MAPRFAHLLQDGPDVAQRQRAELAVLQEVVQILLQHLKHQTSVALVLEAFVGAHKVVLVGVLGTQPVQDAHLAKGKEASDVNEGALNILNKQTGAGR